MKKRILLLALAILLVVQVSVALPEGPLNLTVLNSSRRTPASAADVSAYAGNVSQLNLDGDTVTQTWQGYYGNISGTITLDDHLNKTLYDWALASPEGEVYAATATIDFSQGNIKCFNYSSSVPAEYMSLDELESSLGLASTDVDGVNETFKNETTHTSFYAGLNFIDGSVAEDACPTVKLYNSTEGSTAGLFEEVLLYDLTSHIPIYASIIEEDQIGFSNQSIDFQMIVGEDGHNGDSTATTYYFYLELE